MLPIAGQTGGPIGLNFFVDTQVWLCYRLKKFKNTFSQNVFLFLIKKKFNL